MCFAILVLGLAATGRTVRQPQSYSGRVLQFLSVADTPVLFVGKLSWVYSEYLPCTVQNTRTTTWSISRVFYGFDPGKKVDVRFGSCGLPEAQFKSQDEMLVIAYPGYRNVWTGMTESVVPATDANIRIARKVMDDYLRAQVRELVWPRRVRSPRRILVFEGTIVDPGPQRGDAPCVSTVPPIFPVKFQVAQILRGNWGEKEVTVQFPGCGPLRSPPYREGQRVLVFALRVEPEPPTFFHGGFLLPPEQEAEAMAALRAVEAIPGTR